MTIKQLAQAVAYAKNKEALTPAEQRVAAAIRKLGEQ